MGLFSGIANYYSAKKNAKLAMQAKDETMRSWNDQSAIQRDKSVFRPYNITTGSTQSGGVYGPDGQLTGMQAGLTGQAAQDQSMMYGNAANLLSRQGGMLDQAQGLYGTGFGMLAQGQSQLGNVMSPEQYGQGMLDKYSAWSRPRQQQAFADAGAQAYMGGSIGATNFDPVTGQQMSPWAAAAERTRSDQDYQAYMDSLQYGTKRQGSERDYGFNLMKQGGNVFGLGNEMGGQGLKYGDQAQSLWRAAMAGDEQAMNALKTGGAFGQYNSNLMQQLYAPKDWSGAINSAAGAKAAQYSAGAGAVGGIADTVASFAMGGFGGLALDQLAQKPGAPIEYRR